MGPEELEPMQKPLSQTESKRLLLEKCLQGKSALIDGMDHLHTENAKPQPPSSCRQEFEPESLQQRVGTGTARPQPAVDLKNCRKSLARQALNRLLHLLCRFGPGGFTLRPMVHRMRGVRIGTNVWIGDDVYLDNEYPERIEIQDGAMLELRSTILAHTHGAGRVVIGKNALIGAGAVVVTAANRTLVIGEGSVIMASSLVTGNVAPYTFYGSDAWKPLARITKPFTPGTTYEEFMTTLRPLR